MKTVVVDGAAITDEASFHEVFLKAFGFPAFYGRNMNAWIDCMGYLDEEAAGMSSVHVQAGEILVIAIENATIFKQRSPDVWLALFESVAFVNWRRVEHKEPALLAISAYA